MVDQEHQRSWQLLGHFWINWATFSSKRLATLILVPTTTSVWPEKVAQFWKMCQIGMTTLWAAAVTLWISSPIKTQRKAPVAPTITRFGPKSYPNSKIPPNLATPNNIGGHALSTYRPRFILGTRARLRWLIYHVVGFEWIQTLRTT